MTSISMAIVAVLAAAPASPTGAAVHAQGVSKTGAIDLPGGAVGIGFDDLGYSKALGRVIAPAGRSGRLDLVDPGTQQIVAIAGFSADEKFEGGHGSGTTSADTNGTLLFASDRSQKRVAIVDPKAQKIVGGAPLAGGPDYVRWIAPLGEVWVTEPRAETIERFSFKAGDAPTLTLVGTIHVAGGPESLVVDATRGRAYTNTWKTETVAIDLRAHKEVARWKNGCEESRGIALDEARGHLFVGCEEGRATAIDVAHDGKPLGTVATGKGVDIIAFSPARQHLYVPGGESATLTVVSVGADGALSALATADAAEDAHCVATDDAGHAWVCDPKHGRLLVFADAPSPAR